MTALYITLGTLSGVLLVVLLTAFICFRLTFYSKARDEKALAEYRVPPGKAYEPFREEMIAWVKWAREFPYTEMEIRSFDGLTLRGRYYEKKKGLPIEIQFHGYRGDSDRDLSGAVARACGRSDGAAACGYPACGATRGHPTRRHPARGAACRGAGRILIKEAP